MAVTGAQLITSIESIAPANLANKFGAYMTSLSGDISNPRSFDFPMFDWTWNANTEHLTVTMKGPAFTYFGVRSPDPNDFYHYPTAEMLAASYLYEIRIYMRKNSVVTDRKLDYILEREIAHGTPFTVPVTEDLSISMVVQGHNSETNTEGFTAHTEYFETEEPGIEIIATPATSAVPSNLTDRYGIGAGFLSIKFNYVSGTNMILRENAPIIFAQWDFNLSELSITELGEATVA